MLIQFRLLPFNLNFGNPYDTRMLIHKLRYTKSFESTYLLAMPASLSLLFDVVVDRELSERLVEDVGECGADEIVDERPDERKAGLPHVVDQEVGSALWGGSKWLLLFLEGNFNSDTNDFPSVEQIRDFQFQIAQFVDLNANLQQSSGATDPRYARRLSEAEKMHFIFRLHDCKLFSYA